MHNLNLFVSFGYDGLFTWMASILYLLIVQTRWDHTVYIYKYTYIYIYNDVYIYINIYIHYLFLDLVGLQSAKVLSILHSGNFPLSKNCTFHPPKRTTDSTRKMGFASVQGPKVSRQSRLCVFLQLPQNSHFFCLNKKPNNFFTLSSGWPRLLSSNV